MKYHLAIMLALLVVIAGCAPAETPPAAPSTPSVPTPVETPQEEVKPVVPTASVDLTRKAFVPNELRVKKGTLVTWINKDTIGHTITVYGHSKYNAVIPAGKTHEAVFDEIGEFRYINGALGLKGKIIVE